MNRRWFLKSFVAGVLATKISVARTEVDFIELTAEPLPFKPGNTYECGVEVDWFEYERYLSPALIAAIKNDYYRCIQSQLHAAHWVYGLIPKPVIKISEPPTFAEARNWIVNRGGWIMPYYTPDDWEHMLND